MALLRSPSFSKTKRLGGKVRAFVFGVHSESPETPKPVRTSAQPLARPDSFDAGLWLPFRTNRAFSIDTARHQLVQSVLILQLAAP